MFEAERERAQEEGKMRALMHDQIIKKVIEENGKLEERKREESLMKRALADERKKDLDRQAEMIRQQKIQEEKERDEQR